MKKYLLLLLFFNTIAFQAQNIGDTIKVKAFNYESLTRDTLVTFPPASSNTYEKILLKYSMRCKDGLVSNGSDTNLGCGEWDYSNNTYVVDSTKTNDVSKTVSSHFITNFSGTSFPYKNTPVYDYYRSSQSNVQITSTVNETVATIGTSTNSLDKAINTSNLAGKSHYLFTAAELTAAGITAGDIDGLSLNILQNAGEAQFLKIKLKETSKTDIDGSIDTTGFTEVFYENTTFTANQSKRFQFHTPFTWNGTSNLLVEFSFTNVNASTLTQTTVESTTTNFYSALNAVNETDFLFSNNNYIESNTYKGISGSQNRTVEAWIKTSSAYGEICSWGKTASEEKWTFRLDAGRLRLEVSNGSTVASSYINDGEWHHVAVVLDGTTLSDVSFYLDGVLETYATTSTVNVNTNTTDESSYNVRVSRGTNNRYLTGLVDDVRIWDTALTSTTLNTWKNLKLDSSHPNYSNLKLNYEFEETGTNVLDSSPNANDGTVFGNEFRTSFKDGAGLFKNFEINRERPNISFYQGTYVNSISTTTVDRPVDKDLQYLMVQRSIVSQQALSLTDIINETAPQEIWTLDENIYDESTGNLISTNTLTQDGVINITDLNYIERSPYYNQLVSFVTPYGINLDLGMEGKSWIMDVTDYQTILNGDRRILMTLGGQWQEDMDLEFWFIVGTPPHDLVQYDQLWQGTNNLGIASITQILNDTKLEPKTVALDATATNFKIKSSITGHGSEGEFSQNGGTIYHKLLIDNAELYNWTITQDCGDNPIYPQGGTWVYNRQGWCPGEETLLQEHDLTPNVTPGTNVTIDYTTSTPLITDGAYNYHVAHQLVGYGPANHTLDAAVVDIIAPNNMALYTRVGTICGNPIIKIKNTGSTNLTSLTINYWMNGGTTPQTYTWTGNLEFLETEDVELPSTTSLWQDILSADNKFHVEIMNPNNGTDEYVYNNKYTSNFDVPEALPDTFILEIKTNNYPSQNSYQVVDVDGNVMYSNSLTSANTVYQETIQNSGCLKLEITDSGSDGLYWWANSAQGTGYAVIKSTNGTVLKTINPDFGNEVTYSFTSSGFLSYEQFNLLTSLSVYPNPSSDRVSITSSESMANAKIALINTLGQRFEVNSNLKDANTINFDVDRFSTGMYIIEISIDNIKTTRKLIVK
ncbi:Por secretion system C-terminal sorting domain-containing protein [Mesonia phycicola]|uniref:Por secretion system C-terminal sorting domain-containing protein n=1 Tax=Mesonia phycicola TaxID=579105 RepID=A0A1M6HAN0_9FLAO|nr:LamG-like jellyroll fold domain-containing protein [Mesonia phycicola]SHJ19290.1 Por secretion system C-terminal sorting domain-containing protein [Mesonia phycicola]